MVSPDVHDLVGAYVLDAVEPDERAAFEQHLETCSTCRDDVAALSRAAAALGEVTLEAPPPALWDRIRVEAMNTPQLAPEVRPVTHLPRRRVLQLVAAAAAVVVVGGGVAGIVTQTHHQSAPTAAEVFAAGDAQIRTVQTNHGPVRLGESSQLGLVAVDTSTMRTAGSNHTYQLWLIPHTGKPASLAVLGSATSATAPIGQGTLAITVEPAGGSSQPTTNPLFAVPVTKL